jgi:hypothetical protein
LLPLIVNRQNTLYFYHILVPSGLARPGLEHIIVEHDSPRDAEGKSKSACPVGCSEVSKDRGFSTRLMWREGGAMVTYAYYPDKPKSIRCGEDWLWSKKVQSNTWHHIRMWSKLNTPGQKNGEFKAWLDGELVLSKNDIRYRYDPKFKISRAYITTYAGGSSRSLFAPSQNQYIWCAVCHVMYLSHHIPCRLRSEQIGETYATYSQECVASRAALKV